MKIVLVKNEVDYGAPCGTHNGYVAIPKGHHLHGKDYNEIEVYVHGGLNYSNSADGFADLIGEKSGDKLDGDEWVVGFDTRHYADNAVDWNEEAVRAEAENLKIQLEGSVA